MKLFEDKFTYSRTSHAFKWFFVFRELGLKFQVSLSEINLGGGKTFSFWVSFTIRQRYSSYVRSRIVYFSRKTQEREIARGRIYLPERRNSKKMWSIRCLSLPIRMQVWQKHLTYHLVCVGKKVCGSQRSGALKSRKLFARRTDKSYPCISSWLSAEVLPY